MNSSYDRIKGKVWKFGDDISTDLITPGKYFHLRSNLEELAKHLLEDADRDFPSKVKPGDIIVAGRNFGLGSSREHAPTVIKIAGVPAVLAKSFARIFFRNSINVGLAAIECDTDKISQGDIIEIDLLKGEINNLTGNKKIGFHPLPAVMKSILENNGLVPYIQKYKDFKF